MFPKSTLIISTVAVILFGLFAFSPTASAYQIGVSPNMLSLRSGLVGYWTFDGKDMANGVALDKSGNFATGTPFNIATSTFYAAGKIGQGLKFDGVNDKVVISNTGNLNNLSQKSVFLWVNFKKNKGSYAYDGGYWTSPYGDLLEKSAIDKKVTIYVKNSTGIVVSFALDGYFPLDTWKYVGYTYDGNFVRYYVNGTEISAAVDSLTGTIAGSAYNPTIGCHNNDTNFCANEIVDDVRIYNRALTANEITALYNLGANSHINVSPLKNLTSGLVGYWTFDGKDTPWTSSTAATTLDKSGNGNTGTLTSMSQSTSPAPGKIGQGLNFDSVDDYVQVNSPTSLDDLPAITISAWVYPRGSGENNTGFIMHKSTGFGASGWYFAIDSGGSAGVLNPTFFVDYDGATNLSRVVAAANTIPLKRWTYVTMSWDGTSSATGIKFYVDSVETAYASPTDGAGNRVLDTSSSSQIGNNTSSRTFDGIIDDVRIYNRALTANEITQLYNLGANSHINK